MTAPVDFFVAGQPVTQGNKTAFVIKGTNRAAMREGRSATANDRFKLWRHSISDEARKVAAGRPELPYTGPVLLTCTFGLARPASAPKRRRTWPTGQRSGDVDKLLRAVGDSLTGILYLDDAQIVGGAVVKDYGRTGVRVLLWPADDDPTVDWLPEWQPTLHLGTVAS